MVRERGLDENQFVAVVMCILLPGHSWQTKFDIAAVLLTNEVAVPKQPPAKS